VTVSKGNLASGSSGAYPMSRAFLYRQDGPQ